MACALVAVWPAAAHNMPYALATLRLAGDGGWTLEVRCHTAALVLGAPQGHLLPEAQDALAAMPDAEVARRSALMADFVRRATVVRVDARRVATPAAVFPSVAGVREDGAMTLATARPSAPIVFRGRLPPGARTLSVALPAEVGISLLRVEGGAAQALGPAQASAPIAVKGPEAEPDRTLAQYLALGFEHILPKGLDHILFILAIFLLAPRLKPLTWQVTGFTVAHSMTLALAVFGVVQVPAKWVEVAIAVSIAALAVDNLRTREPGRWRPLTVMAFGLLHGMGFASVLRDLGLPRGQEALALAGFNLGIEGGQLAVLGLAFAGVGWAIPRPWFRSRVTVPASALIAVVAGLWTVQRMFA
jgi:hydrogenase/urease accessory protein HupE